jgi:hypothetical protein
MSTPFIALMLVLAGIMVWAVVEQRLLYRQIDKVRERERVLKKDIRDYRAREAAAAEADSPGEARFVKLLSTLNKLNERAGVGGAMLVMTHDPHSPTGARLRVFREITQTPATSEG